MRPQFRVIFTVSLGKPCLWAQSKAGIRSVAPFFHDGRRCERARVIDGASPNWAAYRAANSPRCQKPLERAHALICSGLLPASNSLLTAHSPSIEDTDIGERHHDQIERAVDRHDRIANRR